MVCSEEMQLRKNKVVTSVSAVSGDWPGLKILMRKALVSITVQKKKAMQPCQKYLLDI